MLPIRCLAGGSNPEVAHAGHCVTCHFLPASSCIEWISWPGQVGYTVSPLSPGLARKPRVCGGRTGRQLTYRAMLSAPLLQSRSASLEPPRGKLHARKATA